VIAYVDDFTSTPGLGNRAGVVLDASGMDAADMQALAATADATETAFGLAGGRHVRFFSRSQELPLCGHATLAFHHLRARVLALPAQRLEMTTAAGAIPIEITADRRIVATLAPARIVATVADPAPICAALGIPPAALVPDLPIQVATTGHAKILIPLRAHATLAALRPDLDALTALGTILGATGFFAFTFDRRRPDVLYQARMFAPGSGVAEDPVTGNGHAAAAYYLSTHRRLPAPRYLAAQGDELGKPGTIEVRVAGDRVSITGACVVP
jgi:PhzF family phenazine biosynthesis protein